MYEHVRKQKRDKTQQKKISSDENYTKVTGKLGNTEKQKLVNLRRTDNR